MIKKNNLELEIADVLLDTPIGVEIGGQHFSLYPATLGKTLMANRMLSKAGFSFEKFAESPIVEALRVSRKSVDNIIRIIAINLMKTKEEVTNNKTVDDFCKKLKGMMTLQEVSTMLISIITRDRDTLGRLVKESGLNMDREDMRRIQAVKSNSGTFVFGRRTMYGQVIDTLCSRYGWTLDYVLWGISYINIEMLLADMEVSVFLSDKEMKRVHISNDRDIINGDDPAMREKIMEMFKD